MNAHEILRRLEVNREAGRASGLVRIGLGIYATEEPPHDDHTLVVLRCEREPYHPGPKGLLAAQRWWWTWHIGSTRASAVSDGLPHATRMEAITAAVLWTEEAMAS